MPRENMVTLEGVTGVGCLSVLGDYFTRTGTRLFVRANRTFSFDAHTTPKYASRDAQTLTLSKGTDEFGTRVGRDGGCRSRNNKQQQDPSPFDFAQGQDDDVNILCRMAM
jgi:hypothetical protein